MVLRRTRMDDIWLVSPGSKCLYRFDGTRMIQYVYDPANPQSLGGIDPEALFAELQKGSLSGLALKMVWTNWIRRPEFFQALQA